MLQKGFLNSQRNPSKTSGRGVKTLLMAGGMIFFIMGMIGMMLKGETESFPYLTLGLVFIIVGCVMVSVGLWMDVFFKFKNQKSKNLNRSVV